MIRSFARRLLSDENGATATEYALIAAIVAVSIAASAAALGNEVSGQYDDVESKVVTASG